MRKICAIALLVFMLLGLIPQTVSAKDTAPSVSADSAVLMDAATGQILYSKNPDLLSWLFQNHSERRH